MKEKTLIKELIKLRQTKPRYYKIKALGLLHRYRLMKNYNLLAVITGKLGSGKSTLAIKFGKAIDDNFKIQENVLFDFDTEELKEKLLRYPKYSAFVVDEAIKSLDRQGWYEKQQKEIVKLFTISRKENKAVILCAPSIKVLNSNLVNNLLDIWIHVYERGKAVVFIKDKSPFSADPWLLNEYAKRWNKFLSYNYVSKLSIENYRNFFKRLPTFYWFMSFPKLSPRENRIYLNLVEKYREAMYNLERKDDKTKIKVMREALLTSAYNYRKVMSFPSTLEKIGMTEEQFIELFGKREYKRLRKIPKEDPRTGTSTLD